MNSNLPDENTIRDYLLGRLPEKDWNDIEEKLLSDKEFADFADSIEDEIIEEYLTIQNHFLRPPERQRKLLFATVLNSRLKKSANKPVPIDRPLRRRPPRLYWALVAATVVLSLATLYLTFNTLSMHNEVIAAKVVSEQAESLLAEKNVELFNLKSELGPYKNSINLGATLRDFQQANEPLHQFQVTQGIKSLRIRISVNDPVSPPYSAELRIGDIVGEPRWSQDNLQPDDRVLVFLIPYYGAGQYYLNISRRGKPSSPSPRIYSFDVVEQGQGSAAKP